ncbi:hypothetical protein P0W64_19200 [Tsukamurella sp. 8F]|uniref:GIY-YIG nuclease family protein n=1 Tax=unclassified Tsukamurella TaxID=2633480 RepID=UPI0023B8D43F|nr:MULTISPECIES: hypothetical protein [unclassified Tsukamurella]MDF0531667.1 hypothetical protein [Tsukamurella sp. 8J]MDF0588913.1 hypothetical protein [Tsukamurella sp. 8F]
MSAPHAEYLAARPFSCVEVLARPCPVPAVSGVYGWWFDVLPSEVMDSSRCETQDGLTLLYAGISPRAPSTRTNPQTIRDRIKNHFDGTASTSTLRLSLGCLLAAELDIGLQLRRPRTAATSAPAKKPRRDFGAGEQVLSAWMAEHAFVSWIEDPEPWVREGELIKGLDLPLNLQGNRSNPFYPELKRARAELTARAPLPR